MAGKFIELSEAAKMLGMTQDELIELRSSGEIHGYRDGASWKFKPEEVERVQAERGGDSGTDASDELDALVADLDIDRDNEGSSILVSDDVPSGSDDTSSSTVIGKEHFCISSKLHIIIPCHFVHG